jgi:hypothetical protein
MSHVLKLNSIYFMKVQFNLTHNSKVPLRIVDQYIGFPAVLNISQAIYYWSKNKNAISFYLEHKK